MRLSMTSNVMRITSNMVKCMISNAMRITKNAAEYN